MTAKFPMQFFGGCAPNENGFFHSVKPTQFDNLLPDSYASPPLPTPGVKTDSLVSRSVVSWLSSIAKILRVRAGPQVLDSIVQAVHVSVVDDPSFER